MQHQPFRISGGTPRQDGNSNQQCTHTTAHHTSSEHGIQAEAHHHTHKGRLLLRNWPPDSDEKQNTNQSLQHLIRLKHHG